MLKVNSAADMFKEAQLPTNWTPQGGAAPTTEVPETEAPAAVSPAAISKAINAITQLQTSIGQVAQSLGTNSPQMQLISSLHKKRSFIQQAIGKMQTGQLNISGDQLTQMVESAGQINALVSNLLSGEQQDEAALTKATAGVDQLLQMMGSGEATTPTTEAPTTEAPTGEAPTAPQPAAKGKGWGAGLAQGVGDLARNVVNTPGNVMRGLQRGWQGAGQPVGASSRRPVITASATSAFNLFD